MFFKGGVNLCDIRDGLMLPSIQTKGFKTVVSTPLVTKYQAKDRSWLFSNYGLTFKVAEYQIGFAP